MKVTSIFSALSVASNIAAIPKTKKIQMGNVTTAKKVMKYKWVMLRQQKT